MSDFECIEDPLLSHLYYTGVCHVQIFGPVLPFITVKDVDEAITIINDG